uniref:Putative ribonuclease H-like domain-containing protein n=1 Tax=Tanacetum cinerariifolium TaxID=118510 RepID=A0A6L2K3F1_TANCI|nr:putative ribonuclease H-like domain-containing protein [Tanacetum cinerariifolium]
MSIPEDHLAKFQKITDAKEMWEAIKSRFGGNDESKKMQKYILKQQFESFSVSNLEGLHKGYDWFQSLLSQLEIHGVDTLSFDDLYNNLKVFESDVTGSTASSSSTQNVAFVSSDSTSSTNEVSNAYGVSTSSGHNSQREGSSSYTDELVDKFDREEMDLKWQMAMISIGLKKFYKKTRRKLNFYAKEPVGLNKTKVECFNCHNKGHFAREYRSKGNQESRSRDAGNTGYKARDNRRKPEKQDEPKAMVTIDGDGVDWTSHAKDDTEKYALMAFNSRNSSSDTEVTSCSKECEESYAKLKKLYDEQREQIGDTSIEIQAYTLAIKKKLLAEAKNAKEELKTKLENFQSSSKGLGKLLNSQMSGKEKSGIGYGNQIHEEVLSYENEILESVFDSQSSDVEDSHVNDRFVKVEGMHASKTSESDAKTSDFSSCESNSSVETLESVPKLVESKPKAVCESKVWSDAPIIEEYESNSDDEYVFKALVEQEKPSCAFNNIVNHVKSPRQTVKDQDTCSQNPKVDKRDWTGLMTELRIWKVITARPIANEIRPKANMYKSHSPITRPFNRTTTPKANFENHKVNTVGDKIVSVVEGNRETAVKASAVSTACYVLNRVLVTKPQNKTPYELITGKFEEKCDEGFLVGYSLNSKAFRPVTAENKDNKTAGPKKANNSAVDQEDQALLEEPERLKRQEKEADDAAETLKNTFAQGTEDLILQAGAARASSTNYDNTASTPVNTTSPSRNVSAAGPSYLYLSNYANQYDTQIPSLEDIYEVPSDGIFTSASSDDEGAVADFTNLESTMNVYRNKKDEQGIVVRNKAMLVAQGHRQEEGIDYYEAFAPLARIEAIRIFLAFASYMGFIVYQMYVKSAFLYGKIDEEVYVSQPLGFIDPKFPKQVYKVVKALYGLHQAPKAWYATIFTFLVKSGYKRGIIDKTLFIKKEKKDIMLDKYVAEILKKLDFMSVKTASTPIKTHKPLDKDEEVANVDVHLYRSMIGSLMYLTASRPGIMYLKGQPKLGLWYPRESVFDLEAYSDSDYARANLDRKSTTRGCHFLGRRLISWQYKKQTIVATSNTEVEYVAAANWCGQVLWIKNQMLDYGFNFMTTRIHMTKGNAQFHEIVDFLSRSSMFYALTISPDVCTIFIEQFWNSATSKTLNNVSQIKAKVAGQRRVTPLFPFMLAQAAVKEGEGSRRPTGPQPTHSLAQPSVGDQTHETTSSSSLENTQSPRLVKDDNAQATEILNLKERVNKLEKGPNIKEGDLNKLDDLLDEGADYDVNEGRSTDKIKVLNAKAEGVSAAGETLSTTTLAVSIASVQEANISTAGIISTAGPSNTDVACLSNQEDVQDLFDDETRIADILVNIANARPRPVVNTDPEQEQRKATPIVQTAIDPKDKGKDKGKMVEPEPIKELTKRDFDAAQIAGDEEDKNQKEWILKSWNFYDNCGVYILMLEDGIEFYMLAERRYPLTKETLKRMMALRLIAESESKAVFDLLRFIQKQIDEIANDSCKELASPKQTAFGKDFSNPLMADSLTKTIWLSMHHVIAIKHLLRANGYCTNKVSTLYGVSTSSGHNLQMEGSSSYTDELMYSFFTDQSSGPQLDHEDLEQVDDFDLEEMDLKWQMAMISMRLKKFYKKTRRKLHFDAKEPVGFDKYKVKCFNCHNKGHFARECRSKRNQERRRRDVRNNRYKARDNRRRHAKHDETKAMVTNDGDGVDWTGHAKDDTKNYALTAFNSSNSSSDTEKLLAEVKNAKEELKTKLENFQGFSKGLSKLLNSQMSAKEKSGLEDSPVNDRFVKVEGMHAVPPPMTGIYMPPKFDFRIDESKFTCGPKQSKTSEFDAKTSDLATWESNYIVETIESVPKPVESKPKVVSKHKVWSDSLIIKEFPINVARQKISSQATSTRIVRKVSTARPIVNDIRPRDNLYKSHSPITRPFNKTTAPKANFINHKVNTAWDKIVSAVGSNRGTAVKALTEDPQQTLKGKGIVDSGCSRHMTGNKAYLVEYQDFNGGPIAFGGSKGQITVLLRVPRQNNMYSFNLKNIVPTGSLACLIAKATVDESNKWNRRLGIKREYSNARTPQQNGVTKRKNMTLIEATRTMLADSFLPNTFWAEAVSTACYVLNRVLVTKPQNKTPYELITGKILIKSYIQPFGCHVTILNTIDHLGKFEEKSDEGFLDGYSLNSKAFRPVTAENKDNKTTGPKEANNNTCKQDNIDARNSEMEAKPPQEYFVLLLWSSYTSTLKGSKAKNGSEKLNGDTGSSTNKEPVDQEDEAFLEELKRLKRQENEADDATETLRKTFSQGTEDLLLQAGATRASSTNYVNTASTPVNTASPSRNEDLFQFKTQKVWILVDLRFRKKGHRQEEGIDYDEVFAPVARIEAIRIFLAFASYMRFIVYRMDVKSSFLYEKINEEVYVSQPPGFIDPKFPKQVYQVVKALYGLYQAHRAWYATLSTFLVKSGYKRGIIDKTLFIKKEKKDIMLVKQKEDGIFISQDKYIAKILKKFDFMSVKTASTLIKTQKPLVKDEEASDADVHLYRSMIGSLMYLTASRPDIMYAVCACSRFQGTQNTSHHHAVKRILRYLKGQPKLGLWYPRESVFDLEAYSNSDYARANLDRKSTTRGCHFLGRRLISW